MKNHNVYEIVRGILRLNVSPYFFSLDKKTAAGKDAIKDMVKKIEEANIKRDTLAYIGAIDDETNKGLIDHLNGLADIVIGSL